MEWPLSVGYTNIVKTSFFFKVIIRRVSLKFYCLGGIPGPHWTINCCMSVLWIRWVSETWAGQIHQQLQCWSSKKRSLTQLMIEWNAESLMSSDKQRVESFFSHEKSKQILLPEFIKSLLRAASIKRFKLKPKSAIKSQRFQYDVYHCHSTSIYLTNAHIIAVGITWAFLSPP